MVRAPVVIRQLQRSDIEALSACHAAAYDDYPPSARCDVRHFELELEAFPDGQFVAERDGQIVGYCTSLIVQLTESLHTYTYGELTGDSSFSTHDPAGDTLYGADIGVLPGFRGKGIAAKLYRARRRLMRQYNLRRMLAYGRIPGYHAYADRMTAREYVDAVIRGEVKDPALSAHLKAGYQVLDVKLRLFNDPSSKNYSTLLEMPNPDFKAERRRIAAAPLVRPVRRVRVCAAQYLMRRIREWDELEEAVRFFVDSADAYYCHYLLFPELFTAHMFGAFPHDTPAKTAIWRLTEYTDRYLEMFTRMAVEKRIYIIGGSHPIARDGKLYNVAHLFTPTGEVHTQDKLHITPGERASWDIQPGQGLKIFVSPQGRFAIQICYDIEFPEVCRLLALAGAETIFVPFSTDDRKAYMRVRYSSHARAVENTIYLVLAGNVGNLPAREYLVNYGQAAVISPSDMGFPMNAVLAEADPNVETVCIADLDFSTLATERDQGSVRPMQDRRYDLYDLQSRVPIEIVRV